MESREEARQRLLEIKKIREQRIEKESSVRERNRDEFHFKYYSIRSDMVQQVQLTLDDLRKTLRYVENEIIRAERKIQSAMVRKCHQNSHQHVLFSDSSAEEWGEQTDRQPCKQPGKRTSYCIDSKLGEQQTSIPGRTSMRVETTQREDEQEEESGEDGQCGECADSEDVCDTPNTVEQEEPPSIGSDSASDDALLESSDDEGTEDSSRIYRKYVEKLHVKRKEILKKIEAAKK